MKPVISLFLSENAGTACSRSGVEDPKIQKRSRKDRRMSRLLTSKIRPAIMHPLIHRLLAPFARLQKRSTRNCSERRRRTISVEQLEPRILYSAAPVEASTADEAPAQEEAPATPVAEVAPVAEAPLAVDVPVPVEGNGGGVGDVSESQEVALVDVDDAATVLNQEVVETLAAEARQRWIDSGISAEQIAALDSVSYDIADVGGAHLGVANGFSITIDDDAGGTGVGNWFIDATPGQDEEFGSGASAASGRFDLLSTLIHEQGHVLGLGDIFGGRVDAMDGLLDTGTRRLPAEGQADGAVAGSITGDHFLTANIVRASTDSVGMLSNGSSSSSVMSANGRYVAFLSDATDLVDDDNNGERDVFVRDLVSGVTTRVSTNSAGMEGTGGNSGSPSISADGRYVAFYSSATDLVANDTNNVRDIFVKDLQTGITTRVSTDADGAQASGGDSTGAKLSADGRYVVFSSLADNLVDNDNNLESDVFRKDLLNGEIERVSVTRNGVEAAGGSDRAAISADGRHVAFVSDASNLVPGDINTRQDIFVKDMKSGVIRRASTNSAGQADSVYSGISSRYPSLSDDGRYVVFSSGSSDLVNDDTNGFEDVFLKDLRTGKTIRLSTDSDGAEGNGNSTPSRVSISSDGRFVVFSSRGDNLVVGDSNGATDIFVKDVKTGVTTRINTDLAGAQSSGGASSSPSISADGRFVSFTSLASNLVPGGNNSLTDIFVKAISSINPYSTSVHVDGAGNLIIEDIEGGDSKDNLFLEVKDGRLEISDKKETVGSSIFGSMVVGTRGRAVSVNLESFTGDIIIRTLGGDDTITIGDLNGLPGGIYVEESSGHDVVKQEGAAILTGAANLSYEAEEIRLEKKSSITVDAGEIDLEGGIDDSASSKRSVGVRANGASLEILGNGDLTIMGTGGNVGSGNRGVDLRNTTITVGGGDLLISGVGGDGVSSNEGVRLGGGTSAQVTGAGDLSIDGAGEGTGNGNRGVNIQNGVVLQAETGRLLVDGDGRSGKSSNVGVLIGKAELSNTGSNDLQILAGSYGSGSNNVGVMLRGTFLTASGSGEVEVRGNGSSSATGSGNRGVDLNSATILAAGGGDATVRGTGGKGANANSGTRAVGTIITSDAGAVTLTGSVSLSGGKNANRGLNFSKGSISAGTSMTVEGNSSGGRNSNEGARLISVQLSAGAYLDIRGNANSSVGSSNRAIYGKNLTVTAGEISVNGDGSSGNGTNNNEGLRLLSSSFFSEDDSVIMQGRGADSATGSGNRGAYLSKVMVESNSEVTLIGRAGAGTNSNGALYVNSSALIASDGYVNVVGNTSSGGTTGANNLGTLLKNTDLRSTSYVSVSGEAGSGTNGNSGLTILGGEVEAGGGSIWLEGEAGATTTGNGNYGASLKNISITRATSMLVNGEGGTGKNSNYGLAIVGGSVSGVAGATTVSGTAEAGTIGSGNSGLSLRNFAIDAGTSVDLIGSGGGGISGNYGIRVDGGGVTGGSDDLTVTGTAQAANTGNGNFGIQAQKTTFQASGNVDVDGIGGGGINSNYGVHLSRVVVASSDTVGVVGNAAATTMGKNNHGVLLDRTSVSGLDEADVRGNGGGGTSNNQGIRIIGGDISADALVYLKGTAFAATIGTGNVGLYIVNGSQIGEDAELSGTGGGGIGKNYGVFMNKNISAPGAIVSGTATDGVSEDEFGNFFP